MKQSIKYGLLLIFALILHCTTIVANQEKSTAALPQQRQEKCILSQNSPIQNALNHIHFFYSTQSSDLGHTDISNVPNLKSLQLLVAYFREHKELYGPSIQSLPSSGQSLNSIKYYLFELRKIVI